MTRTLIRIGMVVACLVPAGLALADWNDVTMTTDTVITLGSSNFSISGSSAIVESLVVQPSYFTITLPSASSSIAISSADRLTFTVDPSAGGFVISTTCSDSASTLTLTGGANGSRTLDVTPTSSTCTTSNAGTNSGGHGGGGGGGYTAPKTTPVNPTLPAPVGKANPAIAAFLHASPNASFLRSVTTGSKGTDVQNLQRFLNALGFNVAKAGDGSSGKETSYFGPATKAALMKYQAAHNIEAIGILGPKTRAQIQKDLK